MSGVEHIKDLVVQTLESKGVLGRMKAELRAQVFSVVQAESAVSGVAVRASERLSALKNNQDALCVAELIADFLQCYDLQFSLSVFLPESSLSGKTRSPDELRKTLHVSSTEAVEREPVLLTLLKDFRRLQTSGVPPLSSTASVGAAAAAAVAAGAMFHRDSRDSGFESDNEESGSGSPLPDVHKHPGHRYQAEDDEFEISEDDIELETADSSDALFMTEHQKNGAKVREPTMEEIEAREAEQSDTPVTTGGTSKTEDKLPELAFGAGRRGRHQRTRSDIYENTVNLDEEDFDIDNTSASVEQIEEEVLPVASDRSNQHGDNSEELSTEEFSPKPADSAPVVHPSTSSTSSETAAQPAPSALSQPPRQSSLLSSLPELPPIRAPAGKLPPLKSLSASGASEPDESLTSTVRHVPQERQPSPPTTHAPLSSHIDQEDIEDDDDEDVEPVDIKKLSSEFASSTKSTEEDRLRLAEIEKRLSELHTSNRTEEEDEGYSDNEFETISEELVDEEIVEEVLEEGTLVRTSNRTNESDDPSKSVLGSFTDRSVEGSELQHLDHLEDVDKSSSVASVRAAAEEDEDDDDYF